MDDDDFDYDDDYSFNDSDGEDEEVRREFELDDIRSDISQNPEDAAARLIRIAENFQSAHSVNAAYELMKLMPSADSFILLARAVALAPQEVDSYSRIAPLESSWAILERHLLPIDLNSLMTCYNGAADILKGSSQPRAYFKFLLCMVGTYISLRRFQEAHDLLQSKFYTEISEQWSKSIWIPSLMYDAKVLEIEICVSSDIVSLSWLSACLESISQSGGVILPVQKTLVNEAQARLQIEMGYLDDARHLLEKIVRGYEETQGTQGSQHLLIRSLVFLVLVATILGNGSYNAQVEIPIIMALRNHSVIQRLLEIPNHFKSVPDSKSMSQMFDALSEINQWLQKDSWKLGSSKIIEDVLQAFVQIQVINSLTPYSRIKWQELQSRIKCHPDLDKNEFSRLSMMKFISNGVLHEQFRINLVDDTIDRIQNSYDWRVSGPKSYASQQKIPLPRRYLEHFNTQVKKQEEAAILNKWKGPASTARMARKSRSNADETYDFLAKTLDEHRSTMLG